MKLFQFSKHQLVSALQNAEQRRIGHGGPPDHDTFYLRCRRTQHFQVLCRCDITIIYQGNPAIRNGFGKPGQIRAPLVIVIPASGMDNQLFHGILFEGFQNPRKFIRAVNTHACLHTDAIAFTLRMIHDATQKRIQRHRISEHACPFVLGKHRPGRTSCVQINLSKSKLKQAVRCQAKGIRIVHQQLRNHVNPPVVGRQFPQKLCPEASIAVRSNERSVIL